MKTWNAVMKRTLIRGGVRAESVQVFANNKRDASAFAQQLLAARPSFYDYVEGTVISFDVTEFNACATNASNIIRKASYNI